MKFFNKKEAIETDQKGPSIVVLDPNVLNTKIDVIMETMSQNIDKIIERDVSLKSLESRANDLSQNVLDLELTSSKINSNVVMRKRRQLCCRITALTLCVSIAFVVIFLLMTFQSRRLLAE